jgi:hypothetical protein
LISWLINTVKAISIRIKENIGWYIKDVGIDIGVT